jgi:uncharacterized protein YecE (DUF72 family)
MPDVLIGTSGFSYKHWRGTFYPEGLAQKNWLGYYCERFSTVELNVTFYRLPKEGAFRKWRTETPEYFLFALKGSRFITHIKRLRDPSEPLKTFMDTIRPLGPKIGALLWQLPPSFKRDTERLKGFLKALRRYRRRSAVEFRNESWLEDEVFDLLRDEGVGLCMADWPPFVDELPITADFTYIRRHGRGGSYDTSYSSDELKNDARRIRKYRRNKKDTYIYFNNDAEGYAPQNALELKRILKV